MKEFIEKLIGRLDKLKTYENPYDSYYENREFEQAEAINSKVSETIDNAISIANELAEEYKGGWIPCSERLPSFDGAFICTAKGIEESLELIYSSFDNSWMDEFDSEYEVIAWQPLPPAFKPKGE